jgi:hypothetical protein
MKNLKGTVFKIQTYACACCAYREFGLRRQIQPIKTNKKCKVCKRKAVCVVTQTISVPHPSLWEAPVNALTIR